MNFIDYASIVMLLSLVYQCSDDAQFEHHSIELAIVVLFRWVRLLYTWRAFPFVGQKIIPFVRSFAALEGILLVTLFVFGCAVHAAFALDLSADGTSYRPVFIGGVRMLFVGDGAGIDMMLSLGRDTDESESGPSISAFILFFVATLIFCICILNLFIAVLGEAYDIAQEQAFSNFSRERAAICLQCFLRPAWPPPSDWAKARGLSLRVSHPVCSCIAILAFAFLMWVGFLRWYAPERPLAASILLVVTMLVSDAVLMQRPWQDDSEEQHYLWICSKAADFDERRKSPGDDAGGSGGAAQIDPIGRISSLKLDSHVRCEQISRELNDVREHTESRLATVDADIESMKPRLNTIEHKSEELMHLLHCIARSARTAT